MDTERAAAKGAILSRSDSDPELQQQLEEAHNFQIARDQEANRHAETMAKGERGFLGGLLGGHRQAPTTIAFLVVVAGLGTGAGCLAAAWSSPDQSPFWATQAERAFGLAGTALGFIFGRSFS